MFDVFTGMVNQTANKIESFRPYLEVLARAHLPRFLWRKIDPVEVVQQTMIRALSALADSNDNESLPNEAWMRAILANTLVDVIRYLGADKRDVSREQSLEAELEKSATGLAGWLAANHTSPSMAAVRHENMRRLATALTTLPEPIGEIVTLKYLREWTVTQIADHLGRTESSVASYLRRGLKELRRELDSPP